MLRAPERRGAAPAMSSELRAEFRLRGGRTALVDAYFTSPLKVKRTFPVGETGAAVTVMDVSPGLMDGDVYGLDWTVGSGCSVYATTQSYAKVHPGPRIGSEQTTVIRVEAGASLVYAPQPVMLYADGALKASTRVELADDATLLLFDAMCAGRIHYGEGEAFRFRLYETELEVRAQGRLAACGRQRFAPAEQTLGSIGLFERDTHAGTLYAFGPSASRDAVEALRPVAERAAGVRCGVSLLARYGLAATAVGRTAWEVQAALESIGRAFAAYAAERAPRGCAPIAWPEA